MITKNCHVTEPAEKNFQGQRHDGTLSLLIQMGRAVSEDNDLSQALDFLLDYMRVQMGGVRAMINLHHRETGRIFIHKSIGLSEEEQARGVYFPGEGITGKVVESGRPIVVRRIGDEPDFLNRTGSLLLDSDRRLTFLCVPIPRNKKVLGTICMERLYSDEGLLKNHLDTLLLTSYMLAPAVELYLVENVDRVLWENQKRKLIDELKARRKPSNIIGSSKAMMEVFALMHNVAQTKATVLLLGESGVGKEMIANAIHFNGPNPEGPMIKFNCAALPESIVESELFGHEKGSFTGATQSRKGRFEQANGGTLFLDEVGELPLSVQAKLLRVLQERTLERVGGNSPVAINMRIIAATNRNLMEMVAEGRFRQDLYYRLAVFPIEIPPLRERGSDVITLAEHFVSTFAQEVEKPITRLSPQALNMIMGYSWPGNVRELANVIQRAVILAEDEDEVIHGYNLPLCVQSPVFEDREVSNGLESRLASMEYEMLVEALRRHKGNTTRTARELGLTRRMIGLRMKKYNLGFKRFRQ
ncbi:MAG: sigma 54-interacting transcriptional regulator [Syntrophobacteraceae bacterium]